MLTASQAILLDTNVLTWSLLQSSALSSSARHAVANADIRYVSPASFYEVAQKVRLGKWAVMAPYAAKLVEVVGLRGIEVVPLDAATCLLAGSLDWLHRDPFDRLIAATALSCDVPIVSSDSVFDGIVTRIW